MYRLRADKYGNPKQGFTFEAPLLPASIQRSKGMLQSVETTIDLGNLLLTGSKDVYMARVTGDSMIEENIFTGDILIVDAKLEPRDGQIVVASLDGEMTVKKLRRKDGKIYLISANQKYLPIEITGYCKFEIQGVVKHIIHEV